MKMPRLLHRILINLHSWSVFVGRLCLLLASIATGSAQDTKTGSSPNSINHFESVSAQSLGLWDGDRPVRVFNHDGITSPKAPNAKSHSNYFHPIYGLDGEALTDDFPKDHLYHRGLYWAWSHIRIAGEEHRFSDFG
jgi:hypothetical protein